MTRYYNTVDIMKTQWPGGGYVVVLRRPDIENLDLVEPVVSAFRTLNHVRNYIAEEIAADRPKIQRIRLTPVDREKEIYSYAWPAFSMNTKVYSATSVRTDANSTPATVTVLGIPTQATTGIA